MKKLALPLLIGLLIIPSVALATGSGYGGGRSHQISKGLNFSGHPSRIRYGQHFKPKRHFSHRRHVNHNGHYRPRHNYSGYYGQLRYWHYKQGQRWFRHQGYGGHSSFFRYRRY